MADVTSIVDAPASVVLVGAVSLPVMSQLQLQQRNRYWEAMSLYEDGLVSEPPKDQPPALPDRPPSPRKIDQLRPA
jgi:hypothetical protein